MMVPALPNREREASRRDEIIRATYRAFIDKGFHNVTLQDISEYAGFSKGVTMYYFRSKEEVFQALLEWLVQRIGARMRSSVEAAATGVAKLEALVDSVFVGARENREFYQVYLDYLALGSRSQPFGLTNAAFYGQCRELGRSIVEQGIREGNFRQVKPDDAAAVLRAIIDGLCIQWLFDARAAEFQNYRQRCLDAARAYLRA